MPGSLFAGYTAGFDYSLNVHVMPEIGAGAGCGLSKTAAAIDGHQGL